MRQNTSILLGCVMLVLGMFGILVTQPLPRGALDLPGWLLEPGRQASSELPPLTRSLPTLSPPTTEPPRQATLTPTPFLPATATPPPQETVLPDAFLVQSPVETAPAQADDPVDEPVDEPAPGLARAPEHLFIPAIGLDAPVVESSYDLVQVEGEVFQQWRAPDYFAAGWQDTSAPLGQPGNTVLNGHHNINGLVFAGLAQLQPGDIIQVSGGGEVFNYTVTERLILPERDQPLAVRVENAAWLQPSEDERITLVTCWPWDSNTHRLIIVAKP